MTIATPEIAVAPVPLRRLTRDEYNHAVRDILGDTTRPADGFPPDEAVSGFEANNVAPVTSEMVERYATAAERLAETAAREIDAIAPCAILEDHDTCGARFIDTIGRRLFRRPLEDDERAVLFSVYRAKEHEAGHREGVRLALEAMLESPEFLYRVEPVKAEGPKARLLDGYEVATRLSFFLWSSTPDDRLLDAAREGHLGTPDEIAREARRMMTDPRIVDGYRSFHRQWLGLAELETSTKDALTPELRAAMIEETLRFSADAAMRGGDTIEHLLTSSYSYVDAHLAPIYGVPAPANGFAVVEMPPRERAGVLTQASVMAVLSSGDQPSPILRGKFIREKLLCEPIPPPPANTVIAPPKVDPTLPTKERFRRHRSDPSCAGCHELMDPIGFGFQHYDGLGTWQTADGAFPVDAVGEIEGLDGKDSRFDGAVELGARLAASPTVRRCFATQWFRYALGRSERAEDTPSIDAAYQVFARAGFDVRDLVVAITMTDAFRYARADDGAAP